MAWKYIRSKIIFFVAATALSVCFFKVLGTSLARDNAYLASFIDEDTCMYKFQVIYSGTDVESNRISTFLGSKKLKSNKNGRLGIYNYSSSVTFENPEFFTEMLNLGISGSNIDTSFTELKKCKVVVSFNTSGEKIGQLTFHLTGEIKTSNYSGDHGNVTTTSTIDTEFDARDLSFSEGDGSQYQRKGDIATPLTFPADKDVNASADDINRAYTVMDTICDDFKEALLFINDGKAYTDVDTLIETAYYLVSAGDSIGSDGVVIENQYGNKYTVKYKSNSDKVTIIEENGLRTQKYTYRMKKGYNGFTNGDKLEDGTTNNLSITDESENDTEYITWEHLFLEAGILYAEGITYANASDIFTVDALENSFVSFTRNVLGQLRGLLQLYEMEDCIFNSGTRGSKAFVYGAYQRNWSDAITAMFFIFAALSVSTVALAVVNMVNKKQLSLFSSTVRYSLLTGIRDLLLALLGICFVWIIVKLLLLINYQFVEIWREYIGTKKLSDSGGGYSTFGGILYQFIYFFIAIYMNAVYIVRQLFLPALIVISPICIMAFGFGRSGKVICENWLKQLIGVIFIQSIHAFVYGFIIGNSAGLRGIESLITCGSFIPLTSMFLNIFGITPSDMLKQAASATNTARAGIQGVTGAATNAVSGTLDGAGSAISCAASGSHAASGSSRSGTGVAGSALKAAGGMARSAGGMTQAAIGGGYELAMQDGSGARDMQRGLEDTGRGAGNAALYMGSTMGQTGSNLNQRFGNSGQTGNFSGGSANGGNGSSGSGNRGNYSGGIGGGNGGNSGNVNGYRSGNNTNRSGNSSMGSGSGSANGNSSRENGGGSSQNNNSRNNSNRNNGNNGSNGSNRNNGNGGVNHNGGNRGGNGGSQSDNHQNADRNRSSGSGYKNNGSQNRSSYQNGNNYRNDNSGGNRNNSGGNYGGVSPLNQIRNEATKRGNFDSYRSGTNRTSPHGQ